VCEDVDSGENRGWPWLSIGTGKREGGLSTNVREQGMTLSSVVAVCRKRLLLQHSERGECFLTNPQTRVGDLIFNTNHLCTGETAGDCVTLTAKFDAGLPMSCPCCYCTFSLQLLSREFQTQLLHYFSKSDNKSNHHHCLLPFLLNVEILIN